MNSPRVAAEDTSLSNLRRDQVAKKGEREKGRVIVISFSLSPFLPISLSNCRSPLPPILPRFPYPSPMTSSLLFVGLDVGGTTMKAGVVDDAGRPLSSVSLPTEPERGQEAGLERMCEALRQAVVAA